MKHLFVIEIQSDHTTSEIHQALKEYLRVRFEAISVIRCDCVPDIIVQNALQKALDADVVYC